MANQRLLRAGYEVRPFVFLADLDAGTVVRVEVPAVQVGPEDLADWNERRWPQDFALMEQQLALRLAQEEAAALESAVVSDRRPPVKKARAVKKAAPRRTGAP